MKEASQVFPVHLRPVGDRAWYGQLGTQWTGTFLKTKSFEGEKPSDCTELLSMAELMVFLLRPILKEEVLLEQVFKGAAGGGLFWGVLIEFQQHNLSEVGHQTGRAEAGACERPLEWQLSPLCWGMHWEASSGGFWISEKHKEVPCECKYPSSQRTVLPACLLTPGSQRPWSRREEQRVKQGMEASAGDT